MSLANSFRTPVDALGITWLSMAAVALFWNRLLNLETLLLVLVGIALTSVLVAFLQDRIILPKSPNIHVLLGSACLLFLFSQHFIGESRSYKVLQMNYSTLMDIGIIFSIFLALALIAYRSPVSDLNIVYPVRIWNVLTNAIMLVIPVLYPQVLQDHYHTYLISGCMANVMFLILGAKIHDELTTSISTIGLYYGAIAYSNDFGLAIGKVAWSAVVSFLLTIGIFGSIIYLELKHRINRSHHPIIIFSLSIEVIDQLLIDSNLLITANSTFETTLVTILLSTTGTLIFLFGLKFAHSKYRGIGLGIIYINILRGLYLFLSRINSPVSGNTLLSFLSFIWVGTLGVVAVGAGKMAQREDLNRYIAWLIKPIEGAADE